MKILRINPRTLLTPLLLSSAILTGCSTGGVFKNYPGALDNGQAITIRPFELEGEFGHFCIYKASAQVDNMPAAAKSLSGNPPKCTLQSNEPGVYRNGTSHGSFFPLLDYKIVTVKLTRSPTGLEETYVLNLNGGMVNPPPVKGARVVSLGIAITESGVRAYRVDMGERHYSKRLIAETKDKQ